MARTNRDYWMACIRACVGLVVMTVAFEVGAVSLLRSSANDKSGDLRRVLSLWGTLAVALPFFLFVFSKAREKAEGSTASPTTKFFAVLVTAGFSLGLTAVAWGSLFLLLPQAGFRQAGLATGVPAELRGFVRGQSVEAGVRLLCRPSAARGERPRCDDLHGEAPGGRRSG